MSETAPAAPGAVTARLAARGLAVLTLINLFNYLDRFVVASLVESLRASELHLTDTQSGALMTGFIVVYMVASPFFGVLGDQGLAAAPPRPRRLRLEPRDRRGGPREELRLALRRAGGRRHRRGRLRDDRPEPPRRLLLEGEARPGLRDLLLRDPDRLRARLHRRRLRRHAPRLAVGLLRRRPPRTPPRVPRADPSRPAPRRERRGRRRRPKARSPDAGWSSYLALAKNRPFRIAVLGYAAYTFGIGGMAFWMPAFLERVRGVPKEAATVQFGLVVVVTGFVGTFAGGFVGDALLKRTKEAYLWVSGVATLLAVPFAFVALTVPDPLGLPPGARRRAAPRLRLHRPDQLGHRQRRPAVAAGRGRRGVQLHDPRPRRRPFAAASRRPLRRLVAPVRRPPRPGRLPRRRRDLDLGRPLGPSRVIRGRRDRRLAPRPARLLPPHRGRGARADPRLRPDDPRPEPPERADGPAPPPLPLAAPRRLPRQVAPLHDAVRLPLREGVRLDPGLPSAGRRRGRAAQPRDLREGARPPERGGVLALFPEGVSHDEPRLMPLKSGAARIALGAASEGPVTVVPAGLTYEARDIFRSGALLRVAEPFTVEPIPLDEKGEPPRTAVKALTERLRVALEGATLQADDPATLDLAAAAESLLPPGEDEGLDARFALRRLLLERAALLRDREPERLAALSARLARFPASSRLRALPCRPRRRHGPRRARRLGLRRSPRRALPRPARARRPRRPRARLQPDRPARHAPLARRHRHRRDDQGPRRLPLLPAHLDRARHSRPASPGASPSASSPASRSRSSGTSRSSSSSAGRRTRAALRALASRSSAGAPSRASGSERAAIVAEMKALDALLDAAE